MLNIGIKEVKVYLDEVKKLIRKGNYYISKRDKNKELFANYLITPEVRIDILLNLDAKDFCYLDKSDNINFKDDYVYVFGKDTYLLNRSTCEMELVNLYIKICKNKDDLVVIISFHNQEYPLIYKFK